MCDRSRRVPESVGLIGQIRPDPPKEGLRSGDAKAGPFLRSTQANHYRIFDKNNRFVFF